MKTLCSIILLIALTGATAFADVKLNALFSDNAVLQQGIPLPVWGTAKDGEKVTVTFSGQTAEAVAKDGRWMLKLQPLKGNATPQTMTVTGANTIQVKNLLVGEVWICGGQSNMQYSLAKLGGWQLGVLNCEQVIKTANDPQLRLFSVPRQGKDAPQRNVQGNWSECTSTNAAGFSAVGYFFGRDLRKARNVPVGLISSNVGGTEAEKWTSRQALEANPELRGIIEAHAKAVADYPQALAKYKADAEKAKQENKRFTARAPGNPAGNGPSSLYNAMIAPLQPFAIAGVIWYQGESNAKRSKEYQTLFPAMIKCWRDEWGQGEFPFLFVQIAPFGGQPPDIREAQLLTWQKTPKTAMAVTTDCGEANNIHPINKEPVGARLALAARAVAYGENIEYSGPVFSEMKVAGNKAVLSFTHTGGGLVAKGGDLKGFTIAGADKKFVPAAATIEGDTISVSSPAVAQPLAVRYGWENVPNVNLFNKSDLPASPFRTDYK